MDLDVLRSLGAGIKKAGEDVGDIILKKYMLDRQEKLERDLRAAQDQAAMEQLKAHIEAEKDIANANREVDRYRILSNLQQSLIGNLGEAEGRFLYNLTTTQDPLERQAGQAIWDKYNILKQKRFSGQKITPQDVEGIPPNLLAELEIQAAKIENLKAQTQAYGNAAAREREREELAEQKEIAAINKYFRQQKIASHANTIKQINEANREYKSLNKQLDNLTRTYTTYCQKKGLDTPDKVLQDIYASTLLQQINAIKGQQELLLETADALTRSLEKEAEIEPLQETPVKNITDVLGQYSEEEIEKMKKKNKYEIVPNRGWSLPKTEETSTTQKSNVVTYEEAIRKMKEEHPEMSIEEIKRIIDNYLSKKK